MISSWLADTTLESFMERHYQREPYVAPRTARAAAATIDWASLRELLEERPNLLAVRNGRLLPEPSDAAEAQGLFGRGCSLVLRGCERHDVRLRSLADAVGEELEGDVAIQVYATPAGFWSFGWHYDCEDVFVVQAKGAKDFTLRRNTVNPAPTLDAMPRDMQFEKETSPLIACTLIPGDWLYIPRGFWHRAHARDHSLSISIGVLSPAARGTAQRRAWDSLPPQADAAAGGWR